MVANETNVHNSNDHGIEYRLVLDAARMVRLGEIRLAADILAAVSVLLGVTVHNLGVLKGAGRLKCSGDLEGGLNAIGNAATVVKSAAVLVGAVAGKGRVQTPEGGRSLAEQVDTVADLLECALADLGDVSVINAEDPPAPGPVQ
jgi:hypothetical protein